MQASLRKAERLSGTSAISKLMSEGRWGNAGVIRYCVLSPNGTDGNGSPFNRIMVSVPKKLYKRAVMRNLYKRRLREAYRTQKHLLPGTPGTDILFIYNSKEASDFQTICSLVAEILRRTADEQS